MSDRRTELALDIARVSLEFDEPTQTAFLQILNSNLLVEKTKNEIKNTRNTAAARPVLG